MKSFLVVLILLTIQALAAPRPPQDLVSSGGDFVGNGGGVWTCRKEGELEWLQLVDLFESKHEDGYELIEVDEKHPYEIVPQIMSVLYKQERQLFDLIALNIETVSKNLKWIDAELEIIEDSLYRSRPRSQSCHGGEIAYEQLANHTPWGDIYVDSLLWEALNNQPVHQAGLIFHETIYKSLRETAQDVTSSRSRVLTGLTVSSIPFYERKKMVYEVMNKRGPASVLPEPAALETFGGETKHFGADLGRLSQDIKWFYLPNSFVFNKSPESPLTMQASLWSSSDGFENNGGSVLWGPQKVVGDTLTGIYTISVANLEADPCTFLGNFILAPTRAAPLAHPYLLLMDWPVDTTTGLATPQKCSDLRMSKALLFL